MRSHISLHQATTKYFSNLLVFKNKIEKEGLPSDSRLELDVYGKAAHGVERIAHRIPNRRVRVNVRQIGVKTSILRLPPFVYGQGQSVFVPIMLRSAAENGFSPYIDEPSRLDPKTPSLVLLFRALFDDL
jgi:hypothetical protein